MFAAKFETSLEMKLTHYQAQHTTQFVLAKPIFIGCNNTTGTWIISQQKLKSLLVR